MLKIIISFIHEVLNWSCNTCLLISTRNRLVTAENRPLRQGTLDFQMTEEFFWVVMGGDWHHDWPHNFPHDWPQDRLMTYPCQHHDLTHDRPHELTHEQPHDQSADEDQYQDQHPTPRLCVSSSAPPWPKNLIWSLIIKTMRYRVNSTDWFTLSWKCVMCYELCNKLLSAMPPPPPGESSESCCYNLLLP